MSRLAYLGVLAFIALGTVWLELALRTRVFTRLGRLVLAVVPVAALFFLWDAYAIAHDQWSFDPRLVTGWVLPLNVPIEELLFFLVVPIASVLTYEAVRSVKQWPGGDETTDRLTP